MSDNRLEALAAFLASNPDLPEGSDTPAEEPKAAGRPVLEISVERKGRGGKTATIVSGFATDAEAATTASALKKRLATGGSARGGEVLIQGECRDRVRDALRALGYKTKG